MSRKEQIKTLWKKCFDESDVSLQFFFDRIYKEENAITLDKGGQIVSMLQMLPYSMSWCGTEIPVSYIYAACTDESERGKGLMRDLLLKSFDIMRERGILMTVLFPANPPLFEYYRTQGYTEVFDYSETLVTTSPTPFQAKEYMFVTLDGSSTKKWYPFFDKHQRSRPITILHSEEHFRTRIDELQMNDGRVVGLLNSQQAPISLAFVEATDERTFIKELFYENNEAKEMLLQTILKNIQRPSIICQTPPRLADSLPSGMGLIVNRSAMIKIWYEAHPESIVSIRELEEMDIHDLTGLLMNYPHRQAYMNLMPE